MRQPQQTETNETLWGEGKRKGKIRKFEKQNPEKCCLQETKSWEMLSPRNKNLWYIAYEKHGKTRKNKDVTNNNKNCQHISLNWLICL